MAKGAKRGVEENARCGKRERQRIESVQQVLAK